MKREIVNLYQHPNAPEPLCGDCVDAVRTYTPQQRRRRLWLPVDPGVCTRCATRPPLDTAYIRANTSIRDGICTQIVKSSDPSLPSLVFVYPAAVRR